MYTKEDIGTEVFLPEWGERPCHITAPTYNRSKIKANIEVEMPDGSFSYFTPKGVKEHDAACNYFGDLPTLSRKPYIQGEPFVCIVERPEPDRVKHIKGLIPNLESKKRTGGEMMLFNGDIGLFLELLKRELNTLQPPKQPNPYPNVQPSGKIRVFSEDQASSIESVLDQLGLYHSSNYDGRPAKAEWVAWEGDEYYVHEAPCPDAKEYPLHHLTDFGLTPEPVDISTDPNDTVFPTSQQSEAPLASIFTIDRMNVDVSNSSGSLSRVEFFTNTIGHVKHHWMALHGLRTFAGKDPFRVHLGRTLSTAPLTKLPTPKPFGPEDDGITLYDQEGNEWTYDRSRWGEPSANTIDLDRTKIIVSVNPDGTTATALRFTREKPEQ